jgi:hypothetical protein
VLYRTYVSEVFACFSIAKYNTGVIVISLAKVLTRYRTENDRMKGFLPLAELVHYRNFFNQCDHSSLDIDRKDFKTLNMKSQRSLRRIQGTAVFSKNEIKTE